MVMWSWRKMPPACLPATRISMPEISSVISAVRSPTRAGGWTAEGTESQSALETSEGFNSSKSYHVRAADHGDNEVNRIRVLLSSALASGATNVTISAEVRWLKGQPEALLRLRGNWLECAAEMSLPPNPGTPGLRNSRYVTNAAPAIVGTIHAPVLPAANQPVIVTAR